MSYTKGKWYRFGGMVDGYGIASQTETGRRIIVDRGEIGCDEAGRIVHCVNNFDELREACKESLEIINNLRVNLYASQRARGLEPSDAMIENDELPMLNIKAAIAAAESE